MSPRYSSSMRKGRLPPSSLAFAVNRFSVRNLIRSGVFQSEAGFRGSGSVGKREELVKLGEGRRPRLSPEGTRIRCRRPSSRVSFRLRHLNGWHNDRCGSVSGRSRGPPSPPQAFPQEAAYRPPPDHNSPRFFAVLGQPLFHQFLARSSRRRWRLLIQPGVELR